MGNIECSYNTQYKCGMTEASYHSVWTYLSTDSCKFAICSLARDAPRCYTEQRACLSTYHQPSMPINWLVMQYAICECTYNCTHQISQMPKLPARRMVYSDWSLLLACTLLAASLLGAAQGESIAELPQLAGLCICRHSKSIAYSNWIPMPPLMSCMSWHHSKGMQINDRLWGQHNGSYRLSSEAGLYLALQLLSCLLPVHQELHCSPAQRCLRAPCLM